MLSKTNITGHAREIKKKCQDFAVVCEIKEKCLDCAGAEKKQDQRELKEKCLDCTMRCSKPNKAGSEREIKEKCRNCTSVLSRKTQDQRDLKEKCHNCAKCREDALVFVFPGKYYSRSVWIALCAAQSQKSRARERNTGGEVSELC